jgi:hypothetical protein
MPLRRAVLPLVLVAIAVTALPGPFVQSVAAADYSLATVAAYDVRPDAGEIGVTIDLAFTNTTPDPDGQFSVFSELKLAIHDGVTAVSATDGEGELTASVEVEEDPNGTEVNVATVSLREDLRFEQTAELQLTYVLADEGGSQQRIRPSAVVFPAWSFGTSGQVNVLIPAGYEVRVDGDPLAVAPDGALTSGPIANPAQWLALVTATRPADFTSYEATVPLDGGTADLQVRAFADDPAWGERTLDLVRRALPLFEREIGLPYPRVGELVLTEAVAADASGFAEPSSSGPEILVAFDQPPFTALHQVAHVWLSAALVDARWIREGLASEVAARVAAQLDIALPFDPGAVTAAGSASGFALDGWSASADPAAETWAHAASWSFVSELTATVGADTLRTVIGRVAASIGPYAPAQVDVEPPTDPAPAPAVPLTSRSLLDYLETLTGTILADAFSQRILGEADVALLPARADARTRLTALIDAAGGWGAPDPVRAAMTAWSFEEAVAQMAEARSWLEARDTLLADMASAGLSAPDRLQQAYRAYGGGPEAQAELEAEQAVVDAYGAAAAEVNAPRTLLERFGLIGGADPAQQMTLANGRFADGDLRGAVEAIDEARRLLSTAEAGGMVRVVSVGLAIIILSVLALVLFRRRATYTAAR